MLSVDAMSQRAAALCLEMERGALEAQLELSNFHRLLDRFEAELTESAQLIEELSQAQQTQAEIREADLKETGEELAGGWQSLLGQLQQMNAEVEEQAGQLSNDLGQLKHSAFKIGDEVEAEIARALRVTQALQAEMEETEGLIEEQALKVEEELSELRAEGLQILERSAGQSEALVKISAQLTEQGAAQLQQLSTAISISLREGEESLQAFEERVKERAQSCVATLELALLKEAQELLSRLLAEIVGDLSALDDLCVTGAGEILGAGEELLGRMESISEALETIQPILHAVKELT